MPLFFIIGGSVAIGVALALYIIRKYDPHY